MLARRIIPCLDVRDGKVVKGVKFRNHEIIGDIVPLAEQYAAQGADELVFYDITASSDQRVVDKSWVSRIAQVIDIPFCVAGGIKTVEDAGRILEMGADKISVNSPALADPQLITRLHDTFGQQCVVVGIDSFYDEQSGVYQVYQFTGDESRTQQTRWQTQDWVKEVQTRGAGEIVLNCMNQDGVRKGYDLPQLSAIRSICTVPLIASGGAGAPEHFIDVFEQADVDGALAASVFHKGVIEIPVLKHFLREQGIEIRRDLNKGKSPMKLTKDTMDQLAWEKMDNLIPCIVQHAVTGKMLMQGYMSPDALEKTLDTGHVTFFSRSKQRLWTKGETSGNVLALANISADCDKDAILALAHPNGPTCHTGTESCWFDSDTPDFTFFADLEQVLAERKHADPESSYTAKLYQKGIKRIAQKVGEEGVETALAATVQDKEELRNEAADLLYHLTVLLQASDMSLSDAISVLRERHTPR